MRRGSSAKEHDQNVVSPHTTLSSSPLARQRTSRASLWRHRRYAFLSSHLIFLETQCLIQLSGTTAAAGTRDNQFVHAYIVYQLLARRVQRDLLLMSALLHQLPTAQKSHSSASTASPGSKSARKAPVDARLFPAVVKLLDSVLQSLEQMRALPIVDDSPDLAAAADARRWTVLWAL